MSMKRFVKVLLLMAVLAMPSVTLHSAERKIYISDYRDKMKAGWVGQIAGVSWGGPTEFRYIHQIVPAEALREWTPGMINEAFHQDDVYVEMTFLNTLETKGFDVSMREAGIDFANSQYRLWHANAEGRNNLRNGIAPPASSHPKYNSCANDIDYQIEADFSGLIAPGCPNMVIALGEKFGRLMNYGDGMWAGQFVGGMYAEAFFETDPVKIVKAGLKCIPAKSRYAEMVRDCLAWYKEDPVDWQKAWKKIDDKYGHDGGCKRQPDVIEATLNGAQILLGVLWGNGDLDETIKISCRGGFDSDCNPSSAGGILFTTIGFSNLPKRFSEALDEETKFEYTDYNFKSLLDVCEKIARQAVVRAGGRIGRDSRGEYFAIPRKKARPSEFFTFANPGPCGDERYTEEEMARIKFVGNEEAQWGVDSKRKGMEAPSFAGHPFEKQLDKLYADIVSQIVDGRPLPNKFVYTNPWRRDAAMVAMVLEKCGRIDLIKDWILSLEDPFDRNNKGNEEPDNLGESLYLLGCVTDKDNPTVKKFVEIAKQKMDANGILKGSVDYSDQPVYSAKWLKLGLEKCGLDSDWVKVPDVKGGYDDIFWMDGSSNPALAGTELDKNYPYLTWAKWHKAGKAFKPGEITDVSSWESHASEANYDALYTINQGWAKDKICYPHTWHAAEMFLLLYELGNK